MGFCESDQLTSEVFCSSLRGTRGNHFELDRANGYDCEFQFDFRSSRCSSLKA